MKQISDRERYNVDRKLSFPYVSSFLSRSAKIESCLLNRNRVSLPIDLSLRLVKQLQSTRSSVCWVSCFLGSFRWNAIIHTQVRAYAVELDRIFFVVCQLIVSSYVAFPTSSRCRSP